MTGLSDATATDVGDSSREVMDGAEEPPQRRPGRPRSAEAEQAIIQATLMELADEGLAGMSLEGVAARAGVGKTTIYRRWPNKEALVLDAIVRMKPPIRSFDTGNLRSDIESFMLNFQRMLEDPNIQRLTLRLVGELAARPDWFTRYLRDALKPNYKSLSEMIARARDRGELRPDVDVELVAAMIGGAPFYHMLLAYFIPEQQPFPVHRYVDMLWEGLKPYANHR
ncbi:MAG: TetR/AcrR family transcriptional regulator [Chloroflexota bacterium]|nr:TetR/AcrR family transcriptional regulator [Chloroflexota bacterium]